MRSVLTSLRSLHFLVTLASAAILIPPPPSIRYYKDELPFFRSPERGRCSVGTLSSCGSNGQATGEPLLVAEYPTTEQYVQALQYISACHVAARETLHSPATLSQVTNAV